MGCSWSCCGHTSSSSGAAGLKKLPFSKCQMHKKDRDTLIAKFCVLRKSHVIFVAGKLHLFPSKNSLSVARYQRPNPHENWVVKCYIFCGSLFCQFVSWLSSKTHSSFAWQACHQIPVCLRIKEALQSRGRPLVLVENSI